MFFFICLPLQALDFVSIYKLFTLKIFVYLEQCLNLVQVIIYFHTLHMGAEKALVSLHIFVSLSDPLLLKNLIRLKY